METMNIGSSFMHDEAVEGWEEYEDVDEEGEGLIESRHPGRSVLVTVKHKTYQASPSLVPTRPRVGKR